ncbi:carboxymuconolactone decarboxylase family protein [Streptosporangium sp. NBC_01756]|uniref:carboxymuconolactone decarboxylase family protein n=1 Tax=Streptosporangium sp. NBC_01756 TaxID=2975950 RepID=UPI002DD7D6E5|nr:carboxymuconolactone decarboxylase family protein [Streptosporangium sp. NBC_01756]WSC85359.1 carboxymuconolactone decarboxylase family protein [Streptosporangium sp. NBC_01756]
MTGLFARFTRRRGLGQIQYVDPVPPSAAHGLVADVYTQVERDFGMLAPPVALHSPAPELLAAAWAMVRETLVVSGAVDRAVKEAVATAVSQENSCPYCVDVHGMMAHGLMTERDAAVVNGGRTEEIADAAIRRAVAWARGNLDEAPVPAEQVPELWGTAVTFQYLNRMVNVFLPDGLFPAGVAVPRRLIGLLARPLARKVCAPGASVQLLPPAPLPDDLHWASESAAVRQAFAAAYAVMEEAGVRAVPDDVRELVRGQLALRGGQPPGLSRSWAQEAAARLQPAERAAGRLALLTAIAAYQVDATVIDDFRRDGADDRKLIELTAWASYMAARHWASARAQTAQR